MAEQTLELFGGRALVEDAPRLTQIRIQTGTIPAPALTRRGAKRGTTYSKAQQLIAAGPADARIPHLPDITS